MNKNYTLKQHVARENAACLGHKKASLHKIRERRTFFIQDKNKKPKTLGNSLYTNIIAVFNNQNFNQGPHQIARKLFLIYVNVCHFILTMNFFLFLIILGLLHYSTIYYTNMPTVMYSSKPI